MKRYILTPSSLLLIAVLTVGCDYSRERVDEMPTGSYRPGAMVLPGSPAASKTAAVTRDSADKATILASSIELIQGAALRPGGDNFRMATQQLNQYFEGTPSSEYKIDSTARAFLADQLPAELLQELENPTWSARSDARHLEDCMLYSAVAGRVAGTGDDLTRVSRVFDWMVKQVQLVPAGSLGSRQLPQVIARPYDLLLRGMATESEGYWAERGWLFMALCRQLGIDVGLITYTKGNVVEPRIARPDPQGQRADTGLLRPSRPSRAAIPWICAALMDGKAYLFDARVGLPVPGPDGKGVATLDQALTDTAILERMDLPGQLPYGTSRASLLASASKLSILIDSSQGFFSPKMKLLQRELAGKNRTVLYRDPAEERDHFAQVLGDRLGEVKLWSLPVHVEVQLFTRPDFVRSTEQTLVLFGPEFPLVYARIKQLRGDLTGAIQEYVSFRLAENVPNLIDKKKTIPKQIHEGLNVYATLYLGLAHLERNDLVNAKNMFSMLLDVLPEPGPGRPTLNMFRWGAHANLGRIYEAKGDRWQAIAHYSQIDPTMQHHGNLLRARELVWQDPMAAPPDPLPPAPPEPASR